MVVEKRKNRRMPIIKKFDEPVMLTVDGKKVPGVILDLSSDGMQLITYANIDLNTEFYFKINIPVLRTETILGKAVWSKTKGDMFNIGIHIINMEPIDAKHINRMAIAYNDCENKIILGVPDVCYLKCPYYYVCEKPQKIKP
ncbi:MAG: PilZ domain-containing protein [Endomicrobium sp.]|jgi:hypothetical protein|nr:PilZ domain-containing protein [Endomicrobium sp.]